MTQRKVLRLQLDVRALTGSAYVPTLRRHLIAAHRIVRPPLRQLSVALVGDARMSRLHHQYLGQRGPTDVISFALDADGRGACVAGEVVVCVPEARRQAKVHGTSIPNEVLLYALHGMLHLCGMDDRTAKDHRRMHATEDRILQRLGIGRVFRAP